jgi:hypothetical protein
MTMTTQELQIWNELKPQEMRYVSPEAITAVLRAQEVAVLRKQAVVAAAQRSQASAYDPRDPGNWRDAGQWLCKEPNPLAGPVGPSYLGTANQVSELLKPFGYRLTFEPGKGFVLESTTGDAAPRTPTADECFADALEAQDAARWRTALRFVGGELSGGWRQCFHFGALPIAKGVDIMRGSVAEHFTQAIDAARKESEQT